MVTSILQDVLNYDKTVNSLELYEYPNESYKVTSSILGFFFVVWFISACIGTYRNRNNTSIWWIFFMLVNTLVNTLMGYYMNNETNTINNMLIQLKDLEQQMQILFIKENLIYTQLTIPEQNNNTMAILSILQISVASLCTIIYVLQILKHEEHIVADFGLYIATFTTSLIGTYFFYKHQHESRILRDNVSIYTSSIKNKFLILNNYC